LLANLMETRKQQTPTKTETEKTRAIRMIERQNCRRKLGMNNSEVSCGLFDPLGNVQIVLVSWLHIWRISFRAGALFASDPVFEFRGDINKDRRTVRSRGKIHNYSPLSP
jgi:hypothetical protein